MGLFVSYEENKVFRIRPQKPTLVCSYWNILLSTQAWTNFSWQDKPWAEFSTLEVAACHDMHLPHSITIRANLELKTRPKPLWGSLSLDITLVDKWTKLVKNDFLSLHFIWKCLICTTFFKNYLEYFLRKSKNFFKYILYLTILKTSITTYSTSFMNTPPILSTYKWDFKTR